MAGIHHFNGFSVVDGDIKIELNLDRLSDRFNTAQYELDTAIMNSMVPFMPHDDGTFIQITQGMSQAIAGSGKVIAAKPPEGRFLYEGKTMVDEKTGSTWARKGARKVLVSKYTGKTNARENLVFSTHHNPEAQAHWFEAAKEADEEQWIQKVRDITGGR